ncbi:MAG: M20/M25/M40 family metallo-hydrolase [Lachnospiraceae bacterium]|nr:M20/M25/M40 family metallo-hydrolase [Lachnospiraceae bacterium]
MGDIGTVNKERIVSEFIKLTSIDAPSYHESLIAEYIKEKLKSLGLRVEEDHAKEKLLEEDETRVDTASNIYAYLEGSTEDAPILFSAHMDTVSPGIGKKAVVHDDGTITSEGNTVLGADDVSGLVSIIEALTVIKEKNIPHRPLEILITTGEEPYCSGSRFIEYERISSKEGYVLDLSGPVGTAAVSAPSIISLKVEIVGKAAHAGFTPEKGINALSIASDALSSIRTGRVYNDLTVNFGKIHGGSGINIVPESITVEGEIRCTEHERALCEAELIKQIFEKAAKNHGGRIDFKVNEHIRSYMISENKNVVKRFVTAAKAEMRCKEPECITTYGGSDANRLNANGIETIVLACAMENSHSTEEYTTVSELERSVGLTLRLMTE